MLPPGCGIAERDGHITVKQLGEAQINTSVYTLKTHIDMSVCLSSDLEFEERDAFTKEILT